MEMKIPNQDIVFRAEHTTLYPAAVLALDLSVLGSGDASPPGGVDCALYPPLVSEGEMTDNSSRQNCFTRYISIAKIDYNPCSIVWK